MVRILTCCLARLLAAASIVDCGHGRALFLALTFLFPFVRGSRLKLEHCQDRFRNFPAVRAKVFDGRPPFARIFRYHFLFLFSDTHCAAPTPPLRVH